MDFVLELSAVPGSSVDKFILQDGALKLKIAAPPVDGAANKKIIQLLSKKFSRPKSSIELVSGAKSKHKKFLFHGMSPEQGLLLLQNITDI